MQYRALLHIAMLTDANRFVVAAQHGMRPDADALLKSDIADNSRVFCDECFGMNERHECVELINSHGSPSGLNVSFENTGCAQLGNVCVAVT